MFALPFHVVSLGLVTAGLFGFSDFWKWLLGYFALVAAWIVLGSMGQRPRGLRPNHPPLFLTEEEVRVVQRHPIYFTAPFMAATFAAAIVGMQLCAGFSVMLLLWRDQWLPATLVALAFVAGFGLAFKANPGRLLRVAHGPLTPAQQSLLNLIDSIDEKHASALAARREHAEST